MTGDSTWEVPEELAWTKKTSPESGEEFYWNQKTGESTWDVPDSEAWVMQNEDL